MKAINQAEVLERLIGRLERLEPDTPGRWGTLSAGEMLCHVADANESVFEEGRGVGQEHPVARRPLTRWYALYVALPWPRGVRTLPAVDPKREGSRPEAFDADRQRVAESLRTLAAAKPVDLPVGHQIFGAMRPKDWYRWAYRHTDHHLRQFGV